MATLAIGAWGLRLSRTTSDFYVLAGRAAALNASAIGGEYLSAASFLGVAGLVLTFGADMLWYPVGWTAGYLVLLVLVAAPLRRSGAYTLPDFAEARLGSPRVRRSCSLLVVAIGWLYLLPQFQGAGVALRDGDRRARLGRRGRRRAWSCASVGAGGMRAITFVQAFQYWLKLTAMLLPAVLLLMVWPADGAPNPPATGTAPTGRSRWPTGGSRRALLDVLADHRDVPRHDGPAPRARPLLHEPRRPCGAADDAVVLGLLGVFYLFPPIYGALGRVYAPDLRRRAHGRRGAAAAAADAAGTGRRAPDRAGDRRRLRGLPVDLERAGRSRWRAC